MKKLQSVCFFDCRKAIQNYDGETILFVWDPDGEIDEDSNFYFYKKEEHKQKRLAEFQSSGVSAEGDAGKTEEEIEAERKAKLEEEQRQKDEEEIRLAIEELKKEKVYRPWNDLGTYRKMIKEERVKTTTRTKISYKLTTARNNINKPVEFADEATFHWSHKIKQNSNNVSILQKQIMNKGCQTHGPSRSQWTNTPWIRKLNKITSYESQVLTNEEQTELIQSKEMKKMLKKVVPTVAEMLTMNKLVDCFHDEFQNFETDEIFNEDSKIEDIVELQCLMDVEIAKEKTVTHIEWFPGDNSIVGISIADAMKLNERICVSGKPRTTYILFWKLGQVKLQSSLVLAVDQEIFCFAFNPDNPKIVCAGLNSGQIAVWDFRHIDMKTTFLEGNEISTLKHDEDEQQRIIITPKFISNLETSQPTPVINILWIEKALQFNKNEPNAHTEQFLSVAAIEDIYLWDINAPVVEKKKKKKKKAKHDPKLECVLRTSISGFQEAPFPTKILLNKDCEAIFGTENGFFGLANIFLTNAPPSKKPENLEQIFKCDAHCLSINTISRSPHFPDIYLTISDWRFIIWKRTLKEPLFISSCNGYVSCGSWSPTRPGVIVIGKTDGALDVWDLTESSNKPVLNNIPISSVGLTQMVFRPNCDTREICLAVGDVNGALRTLKLPRIFTREQRNEIQMMKNFYQREINCINYQRNYFCDPDDLPEEKEPEEECPTNEEKKDEIEQLQDSYLEMEIQLKKELGIKVKEKN